MSNRESRPIPFRLIPALTIALLALLSLACTSGPLVDLFYDTYKQFIREEAGVELVEPDEVVVVGDAYGSEEEEYTGGEASGAAPISGETAGGVSGDLKPVGFLNYGEFDAVVMPYTYIPLGATQAVQPALASTVSSANDGTGDWPNSSRYLTLPMGTYSWCIDWEEGDLDEDGQIDYFHYIQNDPTVLDQDDSDELEFAEEVAISAPPSSGAIYEGRCESAPIEDSCAGKSQQVVVYSSPGWIIGSEYQSDLRAYGNTAEFPPPEADITITNRGGAGFQKAWILHQAGEYLEATFSGPYTAVGVQPHGTYAIGWARVLFDGMEIWRGDTSAYWHDAEGYLHAVYIEVRCFPPGTHTLRIECLGQNGGGGAQGSGGGMDVPISHFGFRK
ncbi:MAG: hypothetical protein ACK2TT_07440 [Anaerolineales bacterium]